MRFFIPWATFMREMLCNDAYLQALLNGRPGIQSLANEYPQWVWDPNTKICTREQIRLLYNEVMANPPGIGRLF
ncbi:MAG: hypothetical protein M0Q51_12945 [Bacteroidales bacterium]|nr:hypothetical protein [Bacteroidales bacterium]